MNSIDEQVLDLIRTVAAEQLLPRFRMLTSLDGREKSAGEVVTVADFAAEAALSDGLSALLPTSIVVGEEASEADPSWRETLRGDEWLWLVDPTGRYGSLCGRG